VFLDGGAFDGAGLGIEKMEFQPAHFQSVAQQHPQRRMLQFPAQRLEHLVSRISSVIVFEFLEYVTLRGYQKGPELVFSNEMFGVRDVGLF